MDAKYYRFLFQNTNDAIYHTGSLWNTYEDERMNFLYISATKQPVKKGMEQDPRFQGDTYPLDVLIISDLNLYYLEKVVQMIYERAVNKVVMPYFTPDDRKTMIEQFAAMGTVSDEAQLFLADPYRYLIDSGVETVYFLKGNGPVYRSIKELEGDYFEEASEEILEQAFQEEGSEYPIHKAGYMICGSWLLYFGNYGEGINSTIVLYHGSIQENPEEEDCTLYIRSFSKLQCCSTYIESKDYSCGLVCNFRNDYDCLNKHNRKDGREYMNGTLLLGNMKIKGNVELLYQRFYSVKEKIRFITLPNGGDAQHWDRRILGFGKEHYRSYWIGPSNSATSAETIRDICISSPYHHYMMTDNYFGVCMSGFLKNRADITISEIND